MLVLRVTEATGNGAAVWHWAPPDVQRYTDPQTLPTNPQQVLMAISGLIVLHRGHWTAESWTHISLQDVFRNREIFRMALAEIPDDVTGIYPQIHQQVQRYAAQYSTS